MSDNSEVMERFGFTICSSCNGDMPNEGMTDGVCSWCNHGEARVAGVVPPGTAS